MTNSNRWKEEKARDDLAFDPLPPAVWLRVRDEGLAIRVNYSEPLSRKLRSITGSMWIPELREWQFPFSSTPEIRREFASIDRLAVSAKQNADEETRKREAAKADAAAKRASEKTEAAKKTHPSHPTSLTMEYLSVNAQAPRHALALEAIGDDTDSLMRNQPFGVGRGWGSRQSVAQIMGKDGRGKLVRAYLFGQKDYSNANSVGSRGVIVTYLLGEGPIYAISAPKTWSHTDRYFARIENGEQRRMTEDEVEACLAR